MTDKEYELFVQEIADISGKWVNNMIKLADKYGENRNKTLKKYAHTQNEVIQTCDFEKFEVTE